MTTYRRVILSTIILAVAIAVVGTILQQQQATVLYTGVLLVEAIGDLLATVYLAWLSYRDRQRPRGWLLLFLVVSSLFITIAYVMIGGLVILRAFGIILPVGLGLTLTGQAVVLIGAVPIMKGMLFWLVQRDRAILPGVVVDEPTLSYALSDPDVEAAIATHDHHAAAEAIMVCLMKAESLGLG